MSERDSETHNFGGIKDFTLLIITAMVILLTGAMAFIPDPTQEQNSEDRSVESSVTTTTTTGVTTTTRTTTTTVSEVTTIPLTTTTELTTSDVDIMASISTTQNSETTKEPIISTTAATTTYVSPNNATVRPIIPECTLPDDLQQYIYDTCVASNIEYEFVMAVILNESRFTPTASNGICFGLMQINKCNIPNLKSFGVTKISDLYDPYKNTAIGISMLSAYRAKYSLGDTMLCYNYGEHGAKKHFGETPSYVRNVLKHYKYYLEINGTT